jgi:hypothetical protein
VETTNQIKRNLQDSFLNEEELLSKSIETDLLMKGKKANLGEIREWNGKKMQKTVSGWIPATSGNKATPAGKEEKYNKEFVSSSGTIRLKDDSDMPSSMWALQGKELKVKGTREVDFASGKQTYYVVEHKGEEIEIPERFLKQSDSKSKSTDSAGGEISLKEKDNAVDLILKENGFMPSEKKYLKTDSLKQAWDVIENYRKQQSRKSNMKISNPITD